MRKILTLVCALTLALAAQAQVQQGETAVGANLVYGSEIESLGLGARFQYGILDQLRAEVGFNGYFEHNHTTWWEVNLNAHYLLNLYQQRLYFYPIGGLNYTMANHKESYERGGKWYEKGEENHIGLNVGCGFEYELDPHFGVTLEYRHTIVRKVDQGVFGVGLNYKF